MISKELSEAIVELNTILKYTSEDVMSKIPKKFMDFLQENASTTYKFDYDYNKSLDEQNIKPKTKALIALIYRGYLCDEQEKQEYMSTVSKTLNEIEEEREKMYSVDNIFKNSVKENKEDDVIDNLPIKIEKENVFNKIIKFLKSIFIK